MKVGMLFKVICVCGIAAILTGCVPNAEMKLTPAAKSVTTYKVVTGQSKDYQFVQPSINKTKERHTGGDIEMVFTQEIESVDAQGNAVANITVKKLKYISTDSQGKESVIDSEKDKTSPLMKLIGQSYKIKFAPNGSVEVVDAAAAREAVKGGVDEKIAAKILSDEEIARRHQVMALLDAKGPYKKGDKWSSVAASPAGMLRSKSFEKVYTLTDIKQENNQTIATVEMNAVPSSKRVEGTTEKDGGMGMLANMFDEKDNYTGKMIINLTTGQIKSYDEVLKAQWVAAESSEEQKSDKGPDQLTMGFTYKYTIERID
jgi:hypothetical protein